ncbi:MAG: PIN domain-containing protein [Thermonemataceae bacterium]|nr:PIN domain-containing protein [Thermonemataceae bacterium]
MTDFVIDANVLISILISGKAGYRPILTFNNFILPDFALIEVEKYKDILKDKTKMSEIQFTDWTYFVFTQLTILPQYVLEQNILVKSERLLEKIDLKDISYVALAMQLDLPLLTRDNPLYQGLRKQGFRKVILFDDFLQTL